MDGPNWLSGPVVRAGLLYLTDLKTLTVLPTTLSDGYYNPDGTWRAPLDDQLPDYSAALDTTGMVPQVAGSPPAVIGGGVCLEYQGRLHTIYEAPGGRYAVAHRRIK